MPPRKGKSSDDSDDDDDELRAIRAARGLKVSEGPPDEDEDAFMPSKSKPNVFAVKGPAHNPVQELVEEVMDDVEAAAMDESRMNFPMSFGQTAMTRKKTGKELQAVHASNKRSSASTGGGGREDLQAMVLEAHAAAVAVQKDEPEPGPALGGAPDGAIGAGVVDQEEEDEDEESDDEDTDDSGLGGLVPCSHEAILKGHSKNVNTMALDPSGSRLLTGGADASVRFWDFNGMDASLRSFRDITPWEGQQVMSLQYSNSGDRFLCATTKNQCNLYTRDGVKEVEFMKGDMYVHDMAQTKGHVAALVTAKWHPTSRNTCMTASIDGTVRLWDIDTCDKKQTTVIKTKNQRGQKATPHSACFSPSGNIIAGCNDGCLKLYDGKAVAKGSTQRAHAEAKGAHMAGAEITSVSVSSDGRNLLSRSRDDTLKVWDMRNLKEALASFGDLDNVYDTTAAVFGPNDTLFMTGTSVRKAKDGTSLGNGQLHVYDRATLKPVRQLGFPSGSVVSLLWHPKINQMFVGGQAGSVHAMYDPRQSEGGIMRSVGKASKKADITSVGINSVGMVYAPHALPMYREDKFATTSKMKRKERADPVKSKRPDLGPIAAAQKGLAFPGMQTSRSFAQHLFKESVGPSGMDYLNQDPREALLKYSETVDANPSFMGVYKETQPDDNPNRFDYSEERAEKRAKPYTW